MTCVTLPDQTGQILAGQFVGFQNFLLRSCSFLIKSICLSSSCLTKMPKWFKKCSSFHYFEIFSDAFLFSVDKEDEICCLIKGCNFLLKNIPDEVFIYQRHGSPEYKFQGVEHDIFPYLLVNIGSGVSLVKVSIPLASGTDKEGI